MEVKHILLNRHSTRKFTDEKIKDEELDLIISAGLNAPSGRNTQDTKVVVVNNKELRDKLSKMNIDVLPHPVSDPFHGGQTLLLVLAPKSNHTGVQDGSAVMTMLQSEAYILGVGSCWINRLKEMMETEYGQELLSEWGIPDYQGIAICVLGYPKEKGYPKKIKDNRVIKAN